MVTLIDSQTTSTCVVTGCPVLATYHKPVEPEQCTLTDQEKYAIIELERLLCPLLSSEKRIKFCDRYTLLRYLKARNWHVEKAFRMLERTLIWRDTYRPDEIKASELVDVAATGKIIRAGFDRWNRPLIVITPARENSTDYARNMRLMIYTLEKAIASMPEGVQQLVLFIDLAGYSMKKAPPISVAKEFIHVLSDHYPERLGSAVFIDPPRIFSALWGTVKHFVDAGTRSKIFVVTSESQRNVLPQYFDMNVLDTRFGGYSKFKYEGSLDEEAQIEQATASIA